MSEQLPVVPSPSSFESPVQAASGSKPEVAPPKPYSSSANADATGTLAAPRPDSQGRTDPTNWVQRWDNDEFEINGGSLFGVGGAILKSQGQLARDLLHGHGAMRYLLGCALLIALSTIVYGAIVGSFSGAEQACLAALKCPLVVLGSSAICLPSFYVFQCLMGARLSLVQAAQSIMYLCAASALILLACAPIVWFFSMSTQVGSPAFLVALHVAVIGLATFFGGRLLFRMHHYVVQRHRGERLFDGRVLTAWLIMYLLVAAQLACFLGPLMLTERFSRVNGASLFPPLCVHLKSSFQARFGELGTPCWIASWSTPARLDIGSAFHVSGTGSRSWAPPRKASSGLDRGSKCA